VRLLCSGHTAAVVLVSASVARVYRRCPAEVEEEEKSMRHRFPVKPVLAGLVALAVGAVVLALVLSGSSSDAGSAKPSAAGSGKGGTIPHITVGFQYTIPVLDPSKADITYQVIGLSLERLERVSPDG